jgi:hypothetical protein
MGVLRSLDETPHPSASLIGYGERLAIELLDDDITAAHPMYQRTLLRHALGLFNRWPGPDNEALVNTLSELKFDEDPASLTIIQRAVTSAARCPAGPPRLSAYDVLTTWEGLRGAWRDTALRMLAESFPAPSRVVGEVPYPLNGRPRNIAEVLESRIDWSSVDATTQMSLTQFLEKLRSRRYAFTTTLETGLRAARRWTVPNQDAVEFVDLLGNTALEGLVVGVIESLQEEELQAAIWLRQMLITIHERVEVGHVPAVSAALDQDLFQALGRQRNS